MRYPDKKISGVGELIAVLETQADLKAPLWFRGQSDLAWKLAPALARKIKVSKAEGALIKSFKQNALPHVVQRPFTEWEWLFLMQHYRLPTRLLDWTESPLVGLYFAVTASKPKNGALWCLDPVALNQHANIGFALPVEIPAFDHDDVLDSYLPSRIASEKTSQLNPIAGIALRNSSRIAAQLGTFTITHRMHTPIEQVADTKHVWRLVIPASAKQKIQRELTTLRITELTLFPELASVASAAEEFVK